MKKFTKAITKVVLTLAAVLAFNAYAGDEVHSAIPAPQSSTVYFDASNWPGSYSHNLQIIGDRTAVELNDVSGEYTNNGNLYGIWGYGLYSNSVLNALTIKNYGVIGNDDTNSSSTGVGLTGTNGNLINYEHAIIMGSQIGILTGGTTADSDIQILNMGQIYSENIGIYKMDDRGKLTINNTATGTILSTYKSIVSKDGIEINNDGLIRSLADTAIYLSSGGVITNNGTIKGGSLKNSISSFDRLTLKGNGTYEGNIEYIGVQSESMDKGILELEDANIDFKDAQLVNWGVIGINGGTHHFDVLNEAQDPMYPRTMVLATTNTTIYSGNDSWGDGNWIIVDSLLNPYQNRQNSFYDKKAIVYQDGVKVQQYDRKNFAKLTVNDLTLYRGGLVVDIRLTEPVYNPTDYIYSEDERGGYWEIYSPGDDEYNPDNSYGGLGYNYRFKKTSGSATDIYQFQRVNHDKIDVRGIADVSNGSLYLLDQTKWVTDDSIASDFIEEELGHLDPKPLDHIELDVLDGNITFDDFGNVELYSNYFGVDHYDNATGTVYLTRDAYNSNTKGQVDWWLKETSLGFESSEPQKAAFTATELAESTVAFAPTAFASTTGAEADAKSATMHSQEPAAVTNRWAADGGHRAIPTDDAVAEDDTPYYNDEGVKVPPPAPVVVPVVTPVITPVVTPVVSKSELLPYQIAKVYSAKITELDTTLQLRDNIYTFQSWDDVDVFMDTLNKLEYASLATSNLNLISNRVNQMFDRLGAGHMRDNNGLNIWADVYFSDDSLDGTGNHGITGRGTEFAAGLDKLFDNTTFGLSMTYTDYTSTVNDDDVHTDIKAEGFGLNLYMMMDQGNLRHKAMLGYTGYNNTGDDVQDFDSSELFASYRAEWTIKTDSLEIKPFAGIRYAFVQFDEMREDAENGLKAFDQDSLESELGVKLVKQFNKLGVSVSGAWMHEFLDSQTTGEAFTSFGNFSQDGIARDTDSFRATIGFEYQLTDKVTLDFDYAKELSDNSESDSVNGKITFRF